MAKAKCTECGKPLGSTIGKCHEHGGKTYRGGKPIYSIQWKIMTRIPVDKLWEVLSEEERDSL